MRVDTVILSIEGTLRQLVNAMQKRLTFRDNFESHRVVIADSGPANETITVNHHLGKIPVGYIANVNKAATVYDFEPENWTTSQITIRCSQANTRIALEIF